jgi:hypothetical protein
MREWLRARMLIWLPLILLPGCRFVTPVLPATQVSSPALAARTAQIASVAVRFHDIAAEAGIHFRLDNGARGEHHFIETTTGGCALFDFDNDGYLDVFLVQAGPTPEEHRTARPPCALYRNNGDGTFTDVTAKSGLAFDQGYAQAVAVADYDNDGWEDLYITAYGGNHLLRNERGHFVDVTRRAGVADNAKGPRWATSAAWGDFNNDGFLDLIVCHYAHWTPSRDIACKSPRDTRTYCSPLLYQPETPTLYRNNGDGTFTDVTKRAGLSQLQGRGLSVVWLDYDGDGWQDVFIANDLTANILLHNNRNGTFTNAALSAGVGVMDNGVALAGMGIAVGDYDNDGREDIVVTNFSNQPKVVYHNLNGKMFDNVTYTCGIGSTSLLMLGWGCEFADYDLDGHKDLIVANGHVNDDVGIDSQDITYRQPKQLFHNRGDGTFQEDPASLGDMAERVVTRGLAVGDFDNDGDPDVLANSHNSQAALFRNEGGNRNAWITFRTVGVHANRDGIGAKLWIRAAGGQQYAEVRSGSSYGSHSDTRLTFGLGRAKRIDSVRIRWPGGRDETMRSLAAGRFYVLTEGHGATVDSRSRPFRVIGTTVPPALEGKN